MMATVLMLTVSAFLAQKPDNQSTSTAKFQSHPFAPSLRELSESEEKKLDAIIDRFIAADVGQLRGTEARRAMSEFEKLGPDSIPALIRGINRAANINHSCPVTVIAKKLTQLLGESQDIKLLQYAREEIGVSVGPTVHAGVLQNLRLGIAMHRNSLVRAGVTELTPGVRPVKAMSIEELADAAGSERGKRLYEVLSEISRRPGDRPIELLGVAADNYEKTTATHARNLLNQNMMRQPAKVVKDRLRDDREQVQLAALRIAYQRNLTVASDVIDLLDDEDESVRDLAHQTLVRVGRGMDHGPGKNASKEERQQAQERWRAWWASQGGR